MNTDEHGLGVDDPLTGSILTACFEVSNSLGCGFLESVYHRALIIELLRRGHAVESKRKIPLFYKGESVGDYEADLIVDGQVIVEVKAVRAFDDVHLAQCLNYLKATSLKVCLLVNFAKPRIVFRRIVRS